MIKAKILHIKINITVENTRAGHEISRIIISSMIRAIGVLFEAEARAKEFSFYY
jgi:hypothetical protein